MRTRGLEPPRGLPHQDLNLARIPISPRPLIESVAHAACLNGRASALSLKSGWQDLNLRSPVPQTGALDQHPVTSINFRDPERDRLAIESDRCVESVPPLQDPVAPTLAQSHSLREITRVKLQRITAKP